MSDQPAIFHDVPAGIRRLLNAPRDLPGALPWHQPALTQSQATPEHRALFGAYLAELAWAIGLAIPWWNAIYQLRLSRGEDPMKALRACYELRPAGPASRPEVIGVVRSFWLQCDALNSTLPPAQQISPQILLLQWVETAGLLPALGVLSGMPFWPIGLDEDGRFC